ncbi:hypothetical protein BXZ70DRAFT_955111 [Cristinia sonorae]|uniref:Flavin reductase like domain-containing protein n=1 Tax=Cristinia sonorae TaxID=1940300 RepID=A0A8K0UIT0_9AGAR|nr:hypothetical protein BXZ70DRAFT_955111 [Cristinia sonorae]
MGSASTGLEAFTLPEFKLTEPPNPNFKIGQKVETTEEGKAWLEGEKAGWTQLKPDDVESWQLYKLMISGITPRPVAFVSSISDTGDENLALFSWFNMVTHSPPLVSIAVSSPGVGKDGLKDTAYNIRATKQFTVSIISEPWVQNANVCSVDAPSDVNEWLISGLTKAPSIHVKPARVKESAFSMECELFQDTDIFHPATGERTSTLILGLVKYFHIRTDMLNERGTVDPAKFMPVGRMGDIMYGSLRGGYRISRPVWKVDGETIREFIKTAEGSEVEVAAIPKETIQ